MCSCIQFTSQYAEILLKQHDDLNQKQHDDLNQKKHNDHSHWRSYIMMCHMAYAETSEKQHDE